jgi:hypothetical protein
VAKSVVRQHVQDLGDQASRPLGRGDLGVDVHQEPTALSGQLTMPSTLDLAHQLAQGTGRGDQPLIRAQSCQRQSLVNGPVQLTDLLGSDGQHRTQVGCRVREGGLQAESPANRLGGPYRVLPV